MYSLENEWNIIISPLLRNRPQVRTTVFLPAIHRIINETKAGYTSLPNAIVNQIEKESIRLANRCHHRSPDFPGIYDLIKTWYSYPARQIRLAENNLRDYRSPLEYNSRRLITDPTGFLVVKGAIQSFLPLLINPHNKNLFIFETALSGACRYQFLYAQIFPFYEGSLPLPPIKVKV